MALRLTGGACKPTDLAPMLRLPAVLLPRIAARSAVSLHTLSLTCTTLRTQVALLDGFWDKQCVFSRSRRRDSTFGSYPFGQWLAEFTAATKVSAAWKAFIPYLRPLQRVALLGPALLDDVLAIEDDLGRHFPLELVFSLSRNYNGQVPCSGSQVACEFYLLSVADLLAVYRSQLTNGLPKKYLPVARDSAFQKFICVQCSDGGEGSESSGWQGADSSSKLPHMQIDRAAAVGKTGRVVIWSPLYEAEVGTSWADFLMPK